MEPSQKDELIFQVLLTVLTTVLFIGMYWISSLPEWKREALLMELQSRLQVHVSDELTPEQRKILRDFSREVSDWNAS
jgi:hypothetical protein